MRTFQLSNAEMVTIQQSLEIAAESQKQINLQRKIAEILVTRFPDAPGSKISDVLVQIMEVIE